MIFPLTNLLCQSFRGSQTWPWCLHATEKLQCKRAATPCPPLSWDLQFCTNNTTVLLAHASPSVHLSTETLHRAAMFCSSTLSERSRNRTSLRWEEGGQDASTFSCSPLVRHRCHGAGMHPALGNERRDGTGENRQSRQHRTEDNASCMDIIISQQ